MMQNQGHVKATAQEIWETSAAQAAGYDIGKSGGKLKDNPHEGGSPKWWAWHKGYKAAKAVELREYNRAHRMPAKAVKR